MRKLLVLVVCLAALAGNAEARRSNANDVKLRIYTNWPDPLTFLGCLNCAPTDPLSIWNPMSRYGWTNPKGVWNQPSLRHLTYRQLVCDVQLISPPPMVFDQYWGFYYRLSVDAAPGNSICAVQMSRRGCAVVRALCGEKPAGGASKPGWTGVVPRPR